MSASDKKPSRNAQTRKLYRDVLERLGSKITKRLDEKPNVDATYDVPYLAGYSVDGKTIYIDRHLSLRIGKTDILPYLLEHEHTEKVLEDVAGLDYDQSHAIATMREHQLIEEDGEITPKEYEAHIRGLCKKIEHEKLTKLPPELDLKPYEESKDYDLLKRIHDEQHREATPKRGKK